MLLSPLILFLLVILGVVVLRKAIKFSSPEHKGQVGEKRVAKAIGSLDPHFYRQMNNVMLKDRFGLTQIDHIVFSPYGIFVVETKNYSGWIFGSANSRKWCQVLPRERHYFQNPYRQNYRHIRCLSAVTGMPERNFIQVVAFMGDCDVKTRKELPKSFVTGKRELLAYIKLFDKRIIQTPVLRGAVKTVEDGMVEQTKEVVTRHLNMIEERVGRHRQG